MGNDLDVTLALTRQQIEQRVSMGDRLDVPRAIEHSADFSRRPAAARAAESLRALGYEVTLVKRGLFRVSLEAKKDCPVDLASAEEFTREVLNVVDTNGGDYDGWGGEVER